MDLSSKLRDKATLSHFRIESTPAMGSAEDQQIALPMTDLLAAREAGGPTGDASLDQDLAAPGLAAEALPADAPGTQQVTVELEGAALGSIDELVDRLVAQAPILGMVRPAICSGDQPRASRPVTCSRNSASRISLRCRCRRRLALSCAVTR